MLWLNLSEWRERGELVLQKH